MSPKPPCTEWEVVNRWHINFGSTIPLPQQYQSLTNKWKKSGRVNIKKGTIKYLVSVSWCPQRMRPKLNCTSFDSRDDVNKSRRRSSNSRNLLQPVLLFRCASGWSPAVMRQRGHLLTINSASGVQGETTAGDIHRVQYRMKKVTVLKGVKPAPGANTSHTNHAPNPLPPFQRRTSPPRHCLATAPPSCRTVPNASRHQMLPLSSSSRSERASDHSNRSDTLVVFD